MLNSIYWGIKPTIYTRKKKRDEGKEVALSKQDRNNDQGKNFGTKICQRMTKPTVPCQTILLNFSELWHESILGSFKRHDMVGGWGGEEEVHDTRSSIH